MKLILPEADSGKVEDIRHKARVILNNPKYQFQYYNNHEKQKGHHEQIWVDKDADKLKRTVFITEYKNFG